MDRARSATAVNGREKKRKRVEMTSAGLQDQTGDDALVEEEVKGGEGEGETGVEKTAKAKTQAQLERNKRKKATQKKRKVAG